MISIRGRLCLALAHLYSGEEAVGGRGLFALRPDDYITSTHRGHGHCLAKGASPKRMFAELLGKEAGYCRGKGGSMHIADPATGNLGANAIVGGSAAIATGAAFSAKHLGNGRVTVCFFGDGAVAQGLLYEAMNLAQLWKLPVIYLCENNLYSEYTSECGDLRGRSSGPAGGLWHARRKRRRAERPRRLCGRETAGRKSASWGWSGFPHVQYLPLSGSSRGRHQPRVLSLEGRGAAMDDRARSHHRSRGLVDRTEVCRCQVF